MLSVVKDDTALLSLPNNESGRVRFLSYTSTLRLITMSSV